MAEDSGLSEEEKEERSKRRDGALNVVSGVLLTLTVIALVFMVVMFAYVGEGWTYSWAEGLVEKHYLYDVGEPEERTVEALSAELDRYSTYYSASDYADTQKSNAGGKAGLGITSGYVTESGYGESGYLVYSVVGNSPAQHAGIKAGDLFVAAKFEGEQPVTLSSSGPTMSDVVNSAEGEYTLITADGREYTVENAEYTASYAHMYTNEYNWEFQGDKLSMERTECSDMDFLPDGFAYIRLDQFYGDAASEIDALAKAFNDVGCTSLILDLRENGGGYVSTMASIAGCFEGVGSTAMYAVYKDGSAERYPVRSHSNKFPKDITVYALANENTASASEALLGALISYGILDYDRIYLPSYTSYMGSSETTYGKGIMQTTYVRTFTGEAMKLTVAECVWPDKETCIHGAGITTADGCAAVETEWRITAGDRMLRDAVSMMKGA